MNALVPVILSFGSEKSNQEILDYLSQEIIVKQDHTLYTIAQIKIVVNNTDAVRLICGTIKAVGEQDPLVWAFAQKLFSTGISFADAETQELITVLGAVGSWPQPVVDAVKGIGITKKLRWQQLGLPFLPSPEDIDAAKATIIEYNQIVQFAELCREIETLSANYFGYLHNEVINPTISNYGTYDDMKPIITTDGLDVIITKLNELKQEVS